MQIKRLISIFLSLAVMIGTAMIVTAVEPRYSDTHSLDISISFSGTTAYCTINLKGAKDTDSITDGHLTLTDSYGTPVGEWTNLKSTNSKLILTKSVSGLTKGETYTLTFSANVNRNGNTEPVSGSKSKTCPKK